MSFANHIQCTLLANQTALNAGTIKINLTDWVIYPGYYDVKVNLTKKKVFSCFPQDIHYCPE